MGEDLYLARRLPLHYVCFSPHNLLCTSAQGMGRRPSTFIFVRILCPAPSLKRMDQGAEPGPVQMLYMAESYLCFLGRCWGVLNAGHCHPLHFCITGPCICSPRLQSGVLLWYYFLGNLSQLCKMESELTESHTLNTQEALRAACYFSINVSVV